MNFTVRSG